LNAPFVPELPVPSSDDGLIRENLPELERTAEPTEICTVVGPQVVFNATTVVGVPRHSKLVAYVDTLGHEYLKEPGDKEGVERHKLSGNALVARTC
jgi:hypothetical protein